MHVESCICCLALATRMEEFNKSKESTDGLQASYDRRMLWSRSSDDEMNTLKAEAFAGLQAADQRVPACGLRVARVVWVSG